MAEATVAGLQSMRPDKRPFVLSRSGFLGIQRHAAVWTGDNHSSWEHLRENLHMVLNLGLCGLPMTGADVGGFGRGPCKYGAVKPLRPSAELFVRWMELGALMPFFRVHRTLYAPRQEPWSFGRRALELCRRVLRRRYRLLLLLYRLALEAHSDGLPIVRPLFMHFDVPKGRGAGQFLLGDGVLAAPILHSGATRREVWLPEGPWVDWNTGAIHCGGRSVSVDAPLGRTPIFIRPGTALFLAEPGRNAEETLRAPLALRSRRAAARHRWLRVAVPRRRRVRVRRAIHSRRFGRAARRPPARGIPSHGREIHARAARYRATRATGLRVGDGGRRAPWSRAPRTRP
ncbi:MAG: glycoside hydrolase family 31 protein [Comamonadaceae bacterium]|nr:glycoside hydrolase family 31 protein [Comamonadaceae bacterium]